jgi:hypothetical protein
MPITTESELARERERWRDVQRRRRANGGERVKRLEREKRRRHRREGRYAAREAARSALARAIESGKVARASACGACGARPTRRDPLEAHHADYSRPLAVRWLCRSCHRAKHRRPLHTLSPSTLRKSA